MADRKPNKFESAALSAADHLVGNVMLRPQMYAALAMEVTGDQFPDGHARTAWDVLAGLFADGKLRAANIEAAMKRGNIPVEWLDDLQSRILYEAPETLKGYAADIRAWHSLQRAEMIGNQLVAAARQGTDTGENLIGKALSQLTAAVTPAGTLEPIEKAAAEVEMIMDQMERGGMNIPGFPSGFADLDYYTRLKPGDLMVLAGRPSMGKSQFAFQVALNLARQLQARKDPGCVAIFSTEMQSRDVLLRLAQASSGVGMDDFYKDRLKPDERMALRDALAELRSLPIFIDASSAPTSTEVAFRATALHQTSPIRLLVFDYAENAGDPSGWNGNEERKISAVAKGMKGIAKNLDTCVLLLSQLNRRVEDRADKRPHLSDLRYSGDMEAASDVVVFLMRPEYYLERGIEQVYLSDESHRQGVCYAFVAKNRNGRAGEVILGWDSESARFGDYVPGMNEAMDKAWEDSF